MTLTVLIHRQTEKEPAPGTLRAYVKQGTLLGPNLLKGQKFTSIDSAVQHVDGVLMNLYKLIEPPTIDYQVEDEKASKP